MNGYYEDLIARLRSETDTLSVALLHEAADAIEEKIQKLRQRKSMLVSNFVPDEQTIPFTQEEISFLVE